MLQCNQLADFTNRAWQEQESGGTWDSQNLPGPFGTLGDGCTSLGTALPRRQHPKLWQKINPHPSDWKCQRALLTRNTQWLHQEMEIPQVGVHSFTSKGRISSPLFPDICCCSQSPGWFWQGLLPCSRTEQSMVSEVAFSIQQQVQWHSLR